jgi:hypothetical protein
VRGAPTLLGPLERVNLNHWTMDKVQKPSILSISDVADLDLKWLEILSINI